MIGMDDVFGCKNRLRILDDRVELAEEILFDVQILDYGLDDQMSVSQQVKV